MVKTIKEIRNVENVALVDKIESIKLDRIINIFYGLNASGKSSLYKAICNALGYEKTGLVNVNKEMNQETPRCCLTIEDNESKICEIKWQNGDIKPKLNVKIFDSDIFLSLVKDDQDNTLSLAYLKQEYFQLLAEFLENLQDKLEERKENLTDRINALQEKLQTKLQLSFEDEEEITEEDIEGIEFPDEDKKKLEKLQKEHDELQKINFADKIKILNNLIAKTDEVIEISQDETETKNGLLTKYIFTQENLGKINNLIDEYLALSKVLHDKRTIQLKDYLPEEWLMFDSWKKFIDSSFDFLKELSRVQQKEYTEKKCPYCLQTLSEQAKKIMESYKLLQEETKKRLSDINSKLNDYLVRVKKAIVDLENFAKKEQLLAKEIKEFSIEETYDINTILTAFKDLKDALINRERIVYSKENLENVEAFFNYYTEVNNKIVDKSKKYEEQSKNKEQRIKEIGTKMEPLEQKEKIVKNRGDLLKYTRSSTKLKKVKDIIGLIIDAKTYVSRLGTDFSKEVFMKEFEKCLDEEYRKLNFPKPTKFYLSSRTTYGENKRVYRVGDRKIKDIFSEGEQKQHALADFFAQIKMENFKGVFIFDDPVTSLDECNMEYVAERIVELVSEEDNQIIIFTHNLVFLNYLLELTNEEKVKHFIRTENAIFLDPNAKLGTEHDLKSKEKEISKMISQMKINEERNILINEYKIRNVYDLLSGYLESCVEVGILKSVISRYRPNIRINSLHKIKWDNSIITDTVRLFSKTSRKGSRHSQPIGIQKPTLGELLKDKADIDDLVSKIKSL